MFVEMMTGFQEFGLVGIYEGFDHVFHCVAVPFVSFCVFIRKLRRNLCESIPNYTLSYSIARKRTNFNRQKGNLVVEYSCENGKM